MPEMLAQTMPEMMTKTMLEMSQLSGATDRQIWYY